EKIAQGQTLENILKSMDMVAEGVWTTKSVYSLARIHEVDMPITSEIYKILYEGKLVKKALIDLMSRAKRSEEEN
ncbi:MAG: NAD(P)H-dependent glycerol-3-phosphate dehydrogenase, partial [Planctomycetota bacterium]